MCFGLANGALVILGDNLDGLRDASVCLRGGRGGSWDRSGQSVMNGIVES